MAESSPSRAGPPQGTAPGAEKRKKPELTAEASVQGGDLCLEASYSLGLTSMAELDININLLDFHKDWVYGPQSVGSWSGHRASARCRGRSVTLAARGPNSV